MKSLSQHITESLVNEDIKIDNLKNELISSIEDYKKSEKKSDWDIIGIRLKSLNAIEKSKKLPLTIYSSFVWDKNQKHIDQYGSTKLKIN